MVMARKKRYRKRKLEEKSNKMEKTHKLRLMEGMRRYKTFFCALLLIQFCVWDEDWTVKRVIDWVQ